MKRALFYSVTLHLVVFVTAWVGVPAFFTTPKIDTAPLPVELVSAEELEKPKPVKEAKKPDPPKPPPEPPAAPEPPPPPPQAAPEPIPEPVPPPPKPKPKPKKKTVEKPKPKIAKAPPPPKRKPKKRPKRKKKPPQEDKLASILKNLAEDKKKTVRAKKKTEPAPAKPEPAKPVVSSIDQQRQARQLAAMVKSQLTPCWNIPAGAKDVHKMQVNVRIRLNPDGSLRSRPEVIDSSRLNSDPSYRVLAESAVRTLLLPKCMPLKLPYDQYSLWKDITFNFDPSEALGQ